MSNRRLKIVVAGNATLDAHIDGRVYEEGNKVTVISGGVKRVFEVVDGPIKYGYKHRTNVDVERQIRGLWNVLKPGGGGYNTVTSIKRRTDIAIDLGMSYIDVSSPDDLIQQSLRELGISDYFFGLRPIPVNAILGGREDKIILKGPMLPRVTLSSEHRATIDEIVKGAHSIAINSVKDEDLVEAIMQSAQKHGTPMIYFIITSSLLPDFAFQKMFPYGFSQISQEDIVSLHGQNPLQFNENQLFELALEYVKRIKRDNINNGNNLFVTLGPRGVLCSNNTRTIYHVMLKEGYGEMVDYAAASKTGSTNGAGDTFAGAVVSITTIRRNADITKVAMRASKASIRYIGYDGPIEYSSFNVKSYK